MAIDYSTNLPGRVNIVDFSITFGNPTQSSDFLKVTIPFTGKANPAKTSSVDLTSYEYSLDDGSTWSTMTAASGSDTSNLTFNVAGTDHSFIWQAKNDIGTRLYNNYIKIRFIATATFSGDSVTTTSTRYIYITRSVSDQGAATDSPFPEDYSGIQGRDLLKNAPRQQS